MEQLRVCEFIERNLGVSSTQGSLRLQAARAADIARGTGQSRSLLHLFLRRPRKSICCSADSLERVVRPRLELAMLMMSIMAVELMMKCAQALAWSW